MQHIEAGIEVVICLGTISWKGVAFLKNVKIYFAVTTVVLQAALKKVPAYLCDMIFNKKTPHGFSWLSTSKEGKSLVFPASTFKDVSYLHLKKEEFSSTFLCCSISTEVDRHVAELVFRYS